MDSSISTRMREILSRFPKSGQNVKDFCKSESISISRYHYWRKKFGFNFRGGRKKGVSDKGPGFVHVKFPEQELPSALSAPSWFEVQLPGGRLLRIPPQFDAGSVKTLLHLLWS